MSNRIVIKKANHVVDVFHGEQGFAPQHWTRFLVVRGFLKFRKGTQMSGQDFNFVKKELGV